VRPRPPLPVRHSPISLDALAATFILADAQPVLVLLQVRLCELRTERGPGHAVLGDLGAKLQQYVATVRLECEVEDAEEDVHGRTPAP